MDSLTPGMGMLKAPNFKFQLVKLCLISQRTIGIVLRANHAQTGRRCCRYSGFLRHNSSNLRIPTIKARTFAWSRLRRLIPGIVKVSLAPLPWHLLLPLRLLNSRQVSAMKQ